MLRAEGELAETPTKRIKNLEKIAAIYHKQEKIAQQRFAGELITQTELNEIKLRILDVEQEIQEQSSSSGSQPSMQSGFQKVTFKKDMPLVDGFRI